MLEQSSRITALQRKRDGLARLVSEFDKFNF
ncbi:MAG: hypothetical protein ACD_39C01606G0001, partial [uncultured bacterium]